MNIKWVKSQGTWRDVANASRTTVNMEEKDGEVKSSWKKRMLLSEHSPIRLISLRWKWTDLPYWVSVHLTRHKFGVDHFVRTQRTDRTGIDRNELPQGALVEHEIIATQQAIINISRKRLCKMASKETTEAWKVGLEAIKEDHPELYEVCVPECIYRGFCPELKSCGYNETSDYYLKREQYIKK